MSYQFNKVKLVSPQRSTFDLSHTKRLSTRAGKLTPVLISEAVPGDYFNGSSEMLVRLAPLLAPIYDQLLVFVHFFFVPNRLLWSEWETFITSGRLGEGTEAGDMPVPPFYNVGDMLPYLDKGSLGDYLGVPLMNEFSADPGDWADIYIDAMPFLAYQLVYQQYYRDRNFVSDGIEDTYPRASGDQVLYVADDLSWKMRNWQHDYFHSALPFTQRGPDVLIPMQAAVEYADISRVLQSDGTPSTTGGLVADAGDLEASGGAKLRIENIDSISNGTSTINDFRTAYALQVWYERNAIAGSRYTESIQAHFGVHPQDSRLQRAEFLGGGRIPIRISEVVSTAWATDADAANVPQANMAGHGVTYGNTNHFKYFCSEHGFIIGILSIMSPPSYHQGLPRMFRRRSFLDYPWPTFAKLGEQQVDKAELYASPANLTPDENGVLPLFGYQSRYADWKWLANTSHGEFHDTLLFWTLTQEFSGSPSLNVSFNEYDDTIQDRIFAVSEADNFWLYVHNKVNVKRALPYFGQPNNLGFA